MSALPPKADLPPDLRTTPAASSSRTPPSRPRASLCSASRPLSAPHLRMASSAARPLSREHIAVRLLAEGSREALSFRYALAGRTGAANYPDHDSAHGLMHAQDCLKCENRIVARTVPISSWLLKTSIKLPQAGLARLHEMGPIGIANCGGLLDHFSDGDSGLRFSERVRSASKNLKPLVQVSKRVRFGSQSGAVCRKTRDGRRTTLRGFASIKF